MCAVRRTRMATSEMSSTLCVRGTIPPPRPKPTKVTNSEKTSTTNNLSQHKYLKLKIQLQRETENTQTSASRDTKIQNQTAKRETSTLQERKHRGAIASAYDLKHQYKLVQDWESEWHALYHHYTTFHQQRYRPQSYQNLKTSHLKGGFTDLPKLLTSTCLSPQVTANQQNASSCKSQHLQSSSKSGSGTSSSSEEDPLCQSVNDDLTPANCDSLRASGMHSRQCLRMTCTDSCLMSTIYMSSNGRAASGDPIRTSWYNEYLRDTLQRMHARTRMERKTTKSAPGGSVSMLSATTYFSQRDVRKPLIAREHEVVDLDTLRAEKTKEVLSKPPPLYKPDPRPRSHWYERRTPDFHTEAKLNNDLIKRTCNW